MPSDWNRRGLKLLSDSPAKWQIVAEDKVHGREREDRAGKVWSNAQLTR